MLGAIAGAALGGIAGSQADKSSSSYTSGIRVAPETALEKSATGQLEKRLGELGQFTDIGPGAQDVTAGLTSQRGLADLLKSYASGGYAPTATDVSQASSLADALLNPSFRQQEVSFARQAARMGRPVNDPIFQNKLRQNLADTRGSFIAQRAQQLPLERLGFMQQYAGVQSGLASQAMQNRQTLMSMGSQLRELDRQYRINTGERYGSSETSSGGGLKGAIEGALGGAGAGLSFQNSLMAMNQRQKLFDKAMAAPQGQSFFGDNFSAMSAAQQPAYSGSADPYALGGLYGQGQIDIGSNFGSYAAPSRSLAARPAARPAAAPVYSGTPSYLQSNANYSGPGYTQSSSPTFTGKWFDTGLLNNQLSSGVYY